MAAVKDDHGSWVAKDGGFDYRQAPQEPEQISRGENSRVVHKVSLSPVHLTRAH
jgi:hypothetical protein